MILNNHLGMRCIMNTMKLILSNIKISFKKKQSKIASI